MAHCWVRENGGGLFKGNRRSCLDHQHVKHGRRLNNGQREEGTKRIRGEEEKGQKGEKKGQEKVLTVTLFVRYDYYNVSTEISASENQKNKEDGDAIHHDCANSSALTDHPS